MLICNQVTLNLTLTLILTLLLVWHFCHHCYKWRVNRVTMLTDTRLKRA